MLRSGASRARPYLALAQNSLQLPVLGCPDQQMKRPLPAYLGGCEAALAWCPLLFFETHRFSTSPSASVRSIFNAHHLSLSHAPSAGHTSSRSAQYTIHVFSSSILSLLSLPPLFPHKYRDQYIQVWLSSLSTNNSRTGEGGNKLRTYRLFKSNFELEAYLCNIKTLPIVLH